MQTDRRSPPASTKHQGKHVAVSLDCIVLDGAFLGMLDNEVGVTEGVILGEGVVVVVDDDGGVLAVDEVLERAECDSVFWCEIHDEGVIIGVLAAVDAVVPVASLLPRFATTHSSVIPPTVRLQGLPLHGTGLPYPGSATVRRAVLEILTSL